MLTNRQFATIAREFAALLRQLKPDIGDDYRSHEEATRPSMSVTLGVSDDGSWSYQTGDNSFTGGAYGHAYWAVIDLDRRSNCKALADDAVTQVADQMEA
jgi:hypothetical protein